MVSQHPRFASWQPPQTYQQVESKLTGIIIYAPRPETIEADNLKSYQCPKCGATTQFDVVAGGDACEYCGYVAQIAAQHVGRQAKEYEFTLETLQQAAQGWGVARRELHCENCGANLAINEGAITSTCPFCASHKVNVRTATADHLRPRFLAPFTVEAKTAQERVRVWLGEGWMHPKELAQITGMHRLIGVYLPFWTFDASITSLWEAEIGYPKTETYYDSGSKSFRTRTRIEWRWENGKTTTIIDDLVVNGSSHISQIILARLHPFDLQQLVAYTPDYLAGWHAHAYDVMLTDAWEVGKRRMREQAKNECYGHVRSSHKHVRNFQMTADFADETWRYVLLPVYLATYTFQQQVYQVMVNGQTGVVAGQKPVAWQKVIMVVAALVVPGLLMIMGTVGWSLWTGYAIHDTAVKFLLGGVALIAIGLVVAFVLYQKGQALEAA
jgi:Zn finger protein HypA/HybF involved in hydrogenase expression